LASFDASTAILVQWSRDLLDLLVPPRCAGCKRAHSIRNHQPKNENESTGQLANVLCPRCTGDLTPLPPDRCPLCQEAASRSRDDVSNRLGICALCRASSSPLESCVAGVAYNGAAETWIRRLKYPGSGVGSLEPEPEQVAKALIRDAARNCPETSPGLIVPIPLHPRRLRERGFNPASILAAALSRSSGVDLSTRLLARIRDTPSQTQLGRRERGSNVRGAFRSSPIPLDGAIWLIDDVVTTGATLREAARALRSAGAGEVHAICCARSLTTRNEPSRIEEAGKAHR
jgi:ComF family protein